jgi:hypothetical protein
MKTACGFSKCIVVIGLLVYLSACASIAGDAQTANQNGTGDAAGKQPANPNTAASIETPLVSANDSLLAMMRYWRYINGLTTEKLEQEFKRINDAYFIRPNNRSGLKRAMLLMMPGTDFYDLNQAKQLVTDIINNGDNAVPAFNEYAQFLLTMIESAQEDYKRYTQLEEKLHQEKLKREQIEQKLEALKSIEESMIQRRN